MDIIGFAFLILMYDKQLGKKKSIFRRIFLGPEMRLIVSQEYLAQILLIYFASLILLEEETRVCIKASSKLLIYHLS